MPGSSRWSQRARQTVILRSRLVWCERVDWTCGLLESAVYSLWFGATRLPPKSKRGGMMSRAHKASQRSLPCRSFTVWTSSPVIPVLGQLSSDWVPWASERTRGSYVGKTVGEITDPAQKKDLLSALRFGNTVPATGMFRGLAGRSAEEVSKCRGIRVGSGPDSWYERDLNSRFWVLFSW